MKWNKKYDSCIKCGKTTSSHASKGVCSKCYYLRNKDKPKNIDKPKKVFKKHKKKPFLFGAKLRRYPDYLGKEENIFKDFRTMPIEQLIEMVRAATPHRIGKGTGTGLRAPNNTNF